MHKLTRVLIVAVYTAIFILPFQNCTKGGGSSGSLGSTGGAVNPALKNAPIPVEVALNQFSFMSCPQAGETTESFDPHFLPYYSLKYGAYDNTNYFNSTNFLAFSGDHFGGVGISKDAMDYLRRSNPTPVPAAIQTYIRSSPYTNNHRIASALIMKDRNPDLLSEYSESFVHLDAINGSTMLNYLGNATQITNSGTLKSGYFASISSPSARSLAGAMNVGKSELDVDHFVSSLNNHYLAIGMVPTGNASDAASIVRNFASPDNDVTKRIAARGYAMSFQYGTKAMTGVTEFDLNPSNYSGGTVIPTDLTTQEAQNWDCFSHIVVRDADRKGWFTTSDPPAVSGVNLTASTLPYTNIANLVFVAPTEVKNPAYGPLKEYYFQSWADVNTALTQLATNYSIRPPNGNKGGTYYPCPSEDPSTLTNTQKDRLKIIRRFLPPDYFDVNMTYGCVVPTRKAVFSGQKCYASGDDNTAFYVQYLNSYNGYPGIDCGPGLNECPVYVSFCWRYH